MKKTMKKILCSLLVVVMCMTSVPLSGFIGLGASDETTEYKVGDIVQFGSYPQSNVTDGATISALNAKAPAWDNWTSYGYYSGNGETGSMVQGDWMRYTDIMYNGNKYRGVKFTQYRPYYTSASPSSYSLYTYQDRNGYNTNTVYWFKFESIDWRVLDPSTGLVMCETIIDSQPYSNTVYSNGGGTYGNFNDASYKNYASDYETSSIRKWLNNDFYNTAFTYSEKKEINTTTLNNDGYYTSVGTTGYEKLDSNSTNDKIFLLSFNEVRNSNFGFSSDEYEYDTARRAQGSDYAQSQGLYVCRISDSTYNNNSYWFLRSPSSHSNDCCSVHYGGYSHDGYGVCLTCYGIRPALRFNRISGIIQAKRTAYFTISSDKYSIDSININDTPKYKIKLLDANGDLLSVDGATVENQTEDIINISTSKKSATEIELTVKPKKDGDATIKISNADKTIEEYFSFNVYSNTITYRADKVPVTDKKLKTNFSRGDLTVDNFSYYFDENKNKYIASMDVYNSSGAIGVVAAYTQDGQISDLQEVEAYKPLPNDFGEFLVYLGAGAVSIAKGENWNYRYSGSSKKTPVEIEVPADGYLTVSCDVTSCEATFIYNLVSIGVDAAFKTASIIDKFGSDTDDLAKKTTKSIVDKVAKYFSENSQWTENAMKKLAKKLSKSFNIAYLETISALSMDLLDEMCDNAGYDFSKLVLDTIFEITKEEIKKFGVMAATKKLIEDKVIGVAEESLLKAASVMFNGGEYINLLNRLLGAYLYNTNSGKTMIVFEPKGENGFVCKDTIKVVSDVITEDVLLNTYILNVSYKNDAFIRDKIYPEFDREDGLDEKELNIDLNRVVEIHEISLYKNGVEIDTTFKATVEMNIPSYINKDTCFVYRVEKNGTCTKLKTRIEGNKIIFETDHFSEYILTGVIEDLQETTPCDVHVYDEVRTEATCTEPGKIVYTCYCGDTYTEIIPITDHTFSDGNSKCSNCDYDRVDDCSCKCHKTGLISKLIWKITIFFNKLLRKNKVCSCGIYHY